MFNPKNRFEEVCGEALRFINPYLAFVTYRFHVEKARDAGKCSDISQVETGAEADWSRWHCSMGRPEWSVGACSQLHYYSRGSVVFLLCVSQNGLNFNLILYRHARGGSLYNEIPQGAIHPDAHLCPVLPPIHSTGTRPQRAFPQKSKNYLQGLHCSRVGHCQGSR